MEYIIMIISAIFVSNIVLGQFLGICPFLGVSKRVETALRLGLADIFVLLLASVCAWALENTVLAYAPYLRIISFTMMY